MCRMHSKVHTHKVRTGEYVNDLQFMRFIQIYVCDSKRIEQQRQKPDRPEYEVNRS